jgi:hypothetical protein
MIKIKGILKEIEQDNIVLYHATFIPLIESIKKHGIIPGGTDVRNFDWANKEYVYLSNDPIAAESFVECSENEDIPEDWYHQIIILAIDVSKLNKAKLQRDINFNPSNFGGEYRGHTDSYMYKGNIPPNAIISYDVKYD